jgi:hypothetical protein
MIVCRWIQMLILANGRISTPRGARITLLMVMGGIRMGLRSAARVGRQMANRKERIRKIRAVKIILEPKTSSKPHLNVRPSSKRSRNLQLKVTTLQSSSLNIKRKNCKVSQSRRFAANRQRMEAAPKKLPCNKNNKTRHNHCHLGRPSITPPQPSQGKNAIIRSILKMRRHLRRIVSRARPPATISRPTRSTSRKLVKLRAVPLLNSNRSSSSVQPNLTRRKLLRHKIKYLSMCAPCLETL